MGEEGNTREQSARRLRTLSGVKEGTDLTKMSKDELWKMVDANGDNNVGRSEYDRLHDTMVRVVTHEVSEKKSAQKENSLIKKFAIVLAILLAMSLGFQGGFSYWVVDSLKDQKVDPSDGVLMTKTGLAGAEADEDDDDNNALAVVTGQVLLDVEPTSATAARLRNLQSQDGPLLEVAKIKKKKCQAAYAAVDKAGHVEGAVKIKDPATGKKQVAEGQVLAILPEDGQYHVVEVGGAGDDATQIYIVKVPKDKTRGECQVLENTADTARRLREPTAKEKTVLRRRVQLSASPGRRAAAVRELLGKQLPDAAAPVADADAELAAGPGCGLYHCFEGDEECDVPSVREACEQWSADGDRCVAPGCRLVHKAPAGRSAADDEYGVMLDQLLDGGDFELGPEAARRLRAARRLCWLCAMSASDSGNQR